MASPVTTAGTLSCPHPGGSVSPTSGARLRISGEPVALFSDVSTLSLAAACKYPDPVSNTVVPCSTIVPVALGASTKLTAGGQPVLLDNLSATATNTSLPPLSVAVTVSAAESKVRAS